MINVLTFCMPVTPPSHLVQVLLSHALQLSPVLVPQLFQLPLVILLHVLAQFLEDAGQLRKGQRVESVRDEKGASCVPARVDERLNLRFTGKSARDVSCRQQSECKR